MDCIRPAEHAFCTVKGHHTLFVDEYLFAEHYFRFFHCLYLLDFSSPFLSAVGRLFSDLVLCMRKRIPGPLVIANNLFFPGPPSGIEELRFFGEKAGYPAV